MKNFTTAEEEYFAACLLDSLIYRSRPQTAALANQLIQRVLPDLFRLNPPPASLPLGEWNQRLIKYAGEGDPGIRFVPVVRRTDDPAKSGGYVAGILEREFRVDADRWIVYPWNLSEHLDRGIQVVIFFDDFLGTGTQFSHVIEEENLQQVIHSCYVAYTPLAAHQSGIQRLQKKFPTLLTSAVETLSEEHQIFHPSALVFEDEINSVADARFFYLDLIQRKGLRIPEEEVLGFGGLELAYAFEHSIPDNSLPVFWWAKSDTWEPLLPR